MGRFWLAPTLVLCACAPVRLPPTPPDIRSHAVIISDTVPICSGVVIGPHIALTAAHCTTRANLRAEGQQVTSTIYPWPGKDIALIEVAHLFRAYPATMRATHPAWAPLRIAGWGCSHMHALEVRGLVQDAVWGPDGYLRGRICPGDSGSGVFDPEGYLVAIGVAYVTEVPVVTRIGALVAWLD